MNQTIVSKNPVVQTILSGQAPAPARLAAARGMLPLPQADLLELLVALSRDEDAELSAVAQETLRGQELDDLLNAAQDAEVAPSVLGYLAGRKDLPVAIHETVAQHGATPDEAVALLAQQTNDGQLIELLIVNQQRLLRAPAIMDAVLSNPARTPEAERRVKELQEEFFQKERGAARIAEELRVQGKKAAAQFVEAMLETGPIILDIPADEAEKTDELTTDDLWLLAEYVEVDDEDIDDSWLSWDTLGELLEESDEQRAALTARILSEMQAEGADSQFISLAQRILKMKIKERVKFAMKGDREARAILIRDSNKIVSGAVIRNPKITENEIEAIAAMRSVSDEALRVIGMSRTWLGKYPIIHNLARNPRTPLAIAMSVLPRLHTRDLQAISNNRNVPEGIRRQAFRLAATRKG
jgi:hypothetical protein